MEKIIQGFSGLSREEKIHTAATFADQPGEFEKTLYAHWHPDKKLEQVYTEFTENAVSNFFMPYSLAPNFRINDERYIVPMVTEESSVVAAACAAARFWWPRGGFVTKITGLLKPGHIHFIWKGSSIALGTFISDIKPAFLTVTAKITHSMKNRGGGISSITLKNLSDKINGYFQLEVLFDTVDAMGANFINSCLETMAEFMLQQAEVKGLSSNLEIIMAVLSNYTPQCCVECKVSCSIQDLDQPHAGLKGKDFARRFETAVLMAHHDVSRAVTHNKGIFNGVAAVIIATGNDFRAVEASGHAWASKDGSYRGLSRVDISGGKFIFSLEIPMPVGVVGGVTNLHPLAKASFLLLKNPGAPELMAIASAAGMANHFSAIKALISGGIQRGHMKLHLANVLKRLGATKLEKDLALKHFTNRIVTHADVSEFLNLQRQEKKQS